MAEQSSGGSWFAETLRAWGPAILAVILIRTFIFEPFRIPSGSMIPTLQIGDHVLVTKYSYGVWLSLSAWYPFVWLGELPDVEVLDLADPQRGDIVVFRYPLNPSQNYIKRVVAIEGDRVEVKNGFLYLNGVAQSATQTADYAAIDANCVDTTSRGYVETLGDVQHDMLMSPFIGNLRNFPETLVPDGHVFVMGDNRDNSMDSRAWGFVRHGQIKGKAHFVWMSWDGCEGRLRSERLFHPLYGSSALAAPSGS